MFALTAAFIALPFFAQSALAGPCQRWYTVQDGDICDSISAANNVSTYQLATINYGYVDEACSNLQPGAKICLGYENEDCSTTYTVVADDSCDLVTEKTGVNSTLIHQNNPQLADDCSNLYIGEVLCIAETVIIPPSPGGYSVDTAIPTTATAAVTTFEAAVIPTPEPTTTASAPDVTETVWEYEDDDESLPFCDEL